MAPIRRNLKGFGVWTLCLLGMAYSTATAQLEIFLDSVIVSNFPEIRTKVRVLENNVTVTGLTAANFTILEDGIVQAPIQVTCTDTVQSEPVSVMLLIDRSGSMGSGGLDAAKLAAKRFLDRLAPTDEAGLMSFGSAGLGSGVSYDQAWTSNKNLVKQAIDALFANGGTPLWRAVRTASQNTRLRPYKKVVIVLTDGDDTEFPPTTTLQDAINQARSDDVTIFAIGLGNQINAAGLTSLAVQTGGEYYFAPSNSDLDQIYQQIAQRITTAGVCELTYTSTIDCWNGSLHTIEIVVNVGGTIARSQALFTVPYDTTTFSYVTLGMMRDYVVESESLITIPLLLTRVSTNRPPSVFQFSIDFDRDRLALVSVDTTSLTSGYTTTVTSTSGGAELVLSGSIPVTRTGTLVLLTFRALYSFESRKAEISISDPEVQQYCTIASSNDGLITISGRCERAMSPGSQTVTSRIRSNVPNPFNPSTVIHYAVGREGMVQLSLYDILGRKLRTLAREWLGIGDYSFAFDGASYPSGRYLIVMEAEDASDSRQILLLK